MNGKIEKILDIYSKGKHSEAYEACNKLLKTNPTEEIKKELYAILAWILYHRKEVEKARRKAQKSGNERALRCLATIAAYYDKDAEELNRIMAKIPHSPARDSLWVIYSRAISDGESKDIILHRAHRWIKGMWIKEPHPDRLNTGHLFNNTARWLIEKKEKKEELILALGFMQSAIGLYGSGEANLHHRASAWYWISVIQEELFDKKTAISACEISVGLWKEQVKADPNNEKFKKNLESNIKRLEELRN